MTEITELETRTIFRSGPAELTEIGLVISDPASPGMDIFGLLMQDVRRAHDATNWWIGDLANYADLWGDAYVQMLDEMDLPFETIRKYANVAKTFPIGKRFPGLKWSHHLVVKALAPKDRKRLLSKAQPEGGGAQAKMSVSELRTAAKELGGTTPVDDAPKEPTKAELADEVVSLKSQVARLEQKCLDSGASPSDPEPLVCPNPQCASHDDGGTGTTEADEEGDCIHCHEPGLAEAELAPWEEEAPEKPSDDQYPDQADPKLLAKAIKAVGVMVRSLDAINYPWKTETLAEINRGLETIKGVQE